MKKLIVLVLPFLLGCTVGPGYVKPPMDLPAAYKEGWKEARPADELPKGKWWTLFGDESLNALEERLVLSNQNLRQAEAQYRQARALAQGSRATLFPTLSAAASSTRSQASASSGGALGTRQSLSLDATWEADVWGAVRRNVESGEAASQASASDLAATRLSLQAELAQVWFSLRALDSQRKLLDETVAAYGKSLDLTRNRYAAGMAGQADVAQAETQYQATRALAMDVGVQRAQLEHAIALLLGQAPSSLSLPALPLSAPPAVTPPAIPPGLPSSLLERRPDVAAAERRAAAANALIGVARGAFFPTLSLSATGGWQGASLALSAPARFWSLGPALAMNLFDAGARRARQDQAEASYDAAVAGYRQTVLTALREVEDNLAALTILETEAKVQDDAVKAARKSLDIAGNQYRAGTASYLNVSTAQSAALSAERNAADIQARRISASVLLIKALGGGWGS
jgi:NodT family efflux transporter outer membrane factor (OMF) lipoprotein